MSKQLQLLGEGKSGDMMTLAQLELEVDDDY
jgi:hypothetical protein